MALGYLIPNQTQGFANYDPEALLQLQLWALETGRSWQMTPVGGARDYAMQKRLWNNWLKGIGALAANPDVSLGPHQASEDGKKGAIAIDLSPRPWDIPGAYKLLLKYGLDLPVGRPGPPDGKPAKKTWEPWHVQYMRRNGSLRTGAPGWVTTGARSLPNADAFPGVLVARHPTDVSDPTRRIQRALKITADGIFGEGTENAVRMYQTWYGLEPDGKVGPTTWDWIINPKENVMTPELAARLNQIVEWLDNRINNLVGEQVATREALKTISTGQTVDHDALVKAFQEAMLSSLPPTFPATVTLDRPTAG